MPLRSSRSTPRVELLLCASPTEAFYSQIAYFRRSLDALGAPWRRCRVVAVFGAAEYPPLPERWRRPFERVEVVTADPAVFARKGSFAASDLRYELLDPTAHLSCLCDADTAFLRPLPRSYLWRLRWQPAVSGVIAHLPFPIAIDGRAQDPPSGFYPGMPHAEAWGALARTLLGRDIARPYRYTLLDPERNHPCPFVPNYGFVAGPPRLLTRLYRALREVHPRVAELLGNDFSGQVAIALAAERERIPVRPLPMRFNFPNDRDADRLHATELDRIVLLHYLRTGEFDRHRIFAEPEEFHRFLALELEGSDRIFQDSVRRTTGGVYPFPP